MTNYIDNKHLQIAMAEYTVTKLRQGVEIMTPNGDTVGYLGEFHTNDELGYGTAIYVVVPTLEDVDAKPSDVEQMIVLFKGSTGIDKVFSQFGDVFNDWIVNDIPLAIKIQTSKLVDNIDDSPFDILLHVSFEGTPQLKDATSYFQRIMKKYSNVSFELYGHYNVR